MVYLVVRAIELPHPGCRAYCGLSDAVAAFVIPILVLIWAAVTVLVLWLRNRV